MKAVIVFVVVVYLVLAFIGCLDREHAIENAGGKEKRAQAVLEKRRSCGTDSVRSCGPGVAGSVAGAECSNTRCDTDADD
jgi:hypothetical protein